jgi:hypothetical protein
MSKNLVYLKLFEAFESIKLSKTLKFIDKDSKSRFMDILKSIANGMDLPYSKYSDDYFQYLPFNRALNLNQRLEDEPCENTSMSQFGNQHGIEGEKCEEGKIKRKWGRGNRIVPCDVCKGSGIKPKKFTKIKWIKFWFNKDGNFINVTGTDGNIRGQVKTLSSALESVPNYENLKGIPEEGELTIVKELTNTELMSLPTGSIVSIRIDGVQLIGRVYKSRNTYIIQNRKQGSEPGGRSWREYGNSSWSISGGEYGGTPRLMVLTKDTSEEDKVDPYSWNAPLSTRNISLEKNSNVKDFLKNAHFAIVLDVLELSKSSFKKKSDIEKERSSSKSGALKLLSNEDIKKMNINRYMSEISKNMEISNDLKNFDKVLFRYFGYSKIGYFTLRERYFGDFESLINRTFEFINEENEERKKNIQSIITSDIKQTLEKNAAFTTYIDNVIRSTKSISKDHERILNKVEELNLAIYRKLKSINIETFEDIDILFAKMRMIRNFWRNSDRYHVRKIYYLIEKISEETYVKRYCDDIIQEGTIEKDISGIDRFIKFVEKI